MPHATTAKQMLDVIRQKMPHLAGELSYSTYTSTCPSCRQTVVIHEVKTFSPRYAMEAECPYCRNTAAQSMCMAIVARPIA